MFVFWLVIEIRRMVLWSREEESKRICFWFGFGFGFGVHLVGICVIEKH